MSTDNERDKTVDAATTQRDELLAELKQIKSLAMRREGDLIVYVNKIGFVAAEAIAKAEGGAPCFPSRYDANGDLRK